MYYNKNRTAYVQREKRDVYTKEKKFYKQMKVEIIFVKLSQINSNNCNHFSDKRKTKIDKFAIYVHILYTLNTSLFSCSQIIREINWKYRYVAISLDNHKLDIFIYSPNRVQRM